MAPIVVKEKGGGRFFLEPQGLLRSEVVEGIMGLSGSAEEEQDSLREE